MLQTERLKVAKHAVSCIAQLADDGLGPVLSVTLTENFVAVIAALDSLAAAATQPLIVADMLPGYDLVILGGRSESASADSAAMRDAAPVPAEFMRSLTMVLDAEFAEAGEGGQTLVYESDDEVTYVLYRSQHRAEALASMGIVEDAVTKVLQ